ncbi:hypothetical protein ABZ319_03415 [Nocardia sp. NPDC005978]|uniref:hypothetical protein n=1 Tax=Nocardia sp. NPDC005978 TaxID=3156725 RepID=UPI0033BE0E31
MTGTSGRTLTTAEIDHDIGAREREIDAIATTLVELDRHTGLQLVRRCPPTGRTAERWAPAHTALDGLWADFGRLRDLIDRVHAARARRRLESRDRAELTRLLRGQPVELVRVPIPLAQRALDGPAERVEFAGFGDLLARMRAGFPGIVEVLDAIEGSHLRAVSRIAPVRAEIATLTELPESHSCATDIAVLAARADTDPLALTKTELDDRLGEIASRINDLTARRAEIEAITRDRGDTIARLRARVDTLRATHERAGLARLAVERTILAGPIPRPADHSLALGAEVTALAADSAAPAELLLDLRRRLTAAIAAATESEELALNLLDRRSELRGRLSAYRAKAARLGVSEDRDVLATDRIAAGLLTRRPCDLAACTRAVADYRQLIAQKSGRRP